MKTKIITDFIHPPIPDRRHDWLAYREGDEEEGHKGEGRTEAEAIQDLLDWETEDEDLPRCQGCGGELDEDWAGYCPTCS